MGKSRGMNERIQKLRDISVNTPVHIDLERAKIETDFYKENDGKYSIPVMRAMTLKEYFSKKTLYLGDGELIVGEKGGIRRHLLPSRSFAATVKKIWSL